MCFKSGIASRASGLELFLSGINVEGSGPLVGEEMVDNDRQVSYSSLSTKALLRQNPTMELMLCNQEDIQNFMFVELLALGWINRVFGSVVLS